MSHLFVISLNISYFCLTHKTGPYQVLPLWTRVDLGVMTMKEYSAFTKAPALL